MLRIRPRDYQLAAAAAYESALAAGHRSALISLPTGTGKTALLALIANALLGRGRVMLVAERREIVLHLAAKLEEYVGVECGVLMGKTKSRLASRVICASKDSLTTARLRWFAAADFALLGIDEGHHAIKRNETYHRVVRHFDVPACQRLLVTATPDRGDGASLIGPGRPAATLAYHYPIFDPAGGPNALDDGWLVAPKAEVVTVSNLDLSPLRNVQGRGEYDPKLIRRLMAVEKVCHQCATPILDYAKDAPALVFCAGIRHVEMMGMVLERWLPGKIAVVHSKLADDVRDRRMAAYKAGQLQILVNDGVATEGFDYDRIALVALCRPCRRRATFAQRVGRGLRPWETLMLDSLASALARRRAIADSGKPFCRVLSFVGTLADLSLMVTPGALLAGKGYETAGQRAEVLHAANPSMDLKHYVAAEVAKQDAERSFEGWLKELDRLQEASEREFVAYLRSQELADVRPVAQYQTQAVSLFNGRGTNRRVAVDPKATGEVVSAKQAKLLIALGAHPAAVAKMPPAQAREQINAAFAAKEQPDWSRLARWGKAYGWLWMEEKVKA